MRAKRPSRDRKIDEAMNGIREDNQLRINVDENFHKKIKQFALDNRTSIKKVVISAIKRYIDYE